MEASNPQPYEKVNPEEIIARLKRIIEFLQNKYKLPKNDEEKFQNKNSN